MRHLAVLLCALVAVALFSGCGGGGSKAQEIVVQSVGFQPSTRTVPVGTTVSWVNSDTKGHSVVCGCLSPTTAAWTKDEDVIDNGFSAPNLEITLGDAVMFTNRTAGPRQVVVKNHESAKVFESPVLASGASATFKSEVAGVFQVTDSANAVSTATITICGYATPSGGFESGVLAAGQRFQYHFTTPGTYTFFDGVNKVFTGKIIVQP